MLQAMQSGLFRGHAAMVEGMVSCFKAELDIPVPRVIATGGFASLPARHTTASDEVAPMLTLDGLRLLWVLNSPNDGRIAGHTGMTSKEQDNHASSHRCR